MTRYIILCCLLLATASGQAQPDYSPAPAIAADLSLLEYFVDTDPGAGNGKIALLPSSGNVSGFSFQANLTGITPGFHRFYLRSRDINGKWSTTNNSFFDNIVVPAYSVMPADPGNIVDIEYFIDNDPGFGLGNKIVLTPAPNLNGQNVLINVTGLSTGVHRLFIRSKDINGKWSQTYFGLFDNSAATPYPAAPQPALPVGEMEYYIDADPGFGNGTAVTLTPGTDIPGLSIEIPLTGLAAGVHTVYIRSKQNPWSLSAYADFIYGSTLPVTWMYVKGSVRDQKGYINWATAAESNTSRFVVEHGTDGQNFAAIGEVIASGNSSSVQQYSYTHDRLPAGINYYRIKQIDMDGRFSYSKVISLLLHDGAMQPVLFPNPVHTQLYITGYGQKLVRRADLLDVSGRLLQSRSFNTVQVVYALDMADVKPGIYVIRLYLAGTTDVYKVIRR